MTTQEPTEEQDKSYLCYVLFHKGDPILIEKHLPFIQENIEIMRKPDTAAPKPTQDTCGVCGEPKQASEYCKNECRYLNKATWGDNVTEQDVVASLLGELRAGAYLPTVVKQIDYVYKATDPRSPTDVRANTKPKRELAPLDPPSSIDPFHARNHPEPCEEHSQVLPSSSKAKYVLGACWTINCKDCEIGGCNCFDIEKAAAAVELLLKEAEKSFAQQIADKNREIKEAVRQARIDELKWVATHSGGVITPGYEIWEGTDKEDWSYQIPKRKLKDRINQLKNKE